MLWGSTWLERFDSLELLLDLGGNGCSCGAAEFMMSFSYLVMGHGNAVCGDGVAIKM